jgi:hypothetical protein
VIEKALRFGPAGTLAGILTEPAKDRAHPGAPVVVMWNVGLNHHVGPWRFNVELARDLAARGVSSFRFDLSGLGDSEARRDTSSDHARALADVKEAMTFVASRTQATTFALIGFCSSVDAAHVVGVEDDRVVAVVYLEGYAFRTKGFWRRYALRVLQRERIVRYLKSSAPRVFGSELVGTGWQVARAAIFAREYPSTERLREDYASMVAANKKLLFVYVGGDTNYNYRGQFFEMFGSPGLEQAVDLDYFPSMDHTFFRVPDRRRVLERVTGWICSLPAAVVRRAARAGNE